MRDRTKTRAVAGAAALLTVAAGLGVRSALGGEAAKYAGDALYTVLVHALIVVAAPRVRPAVAAGTALVISCAIEFAQLTGVPAELSSRSTLARLVLGSTFNAPDLLWYAVGAALAGLAHRAALAGLAHRAAAARPARHAAGPGTDGGRSRALVQGGRQAD
ncbi:DUF2809 domain-containing protein [Streptomyces sp. URMC 123]|uniref:ribosomal maturation YjgA family protein n=1 Tax=Streptomyces sp. URMC 123 TaxID=3423403 RepID=UPI003F1A62E5